MTGADPRAVHDRPSPIELVEAVREFLETRVEPGGEGRDRLHRKVAANVLATVTRQWEHAAQDGRAHAERLADLGVRDNAALAELVAALEEDDPRYARVSAAMSGWARDKVRVSNPRYLEG